MPKSYNSMSVPDAPDNSYASKSEENSKKLTTNHAGAVHGKRVNTENAFFKGSVESAGRSIMADILIPAAKDTIYNMLNSFMSSILYGNAEIPTRGRSGNMRTMDGRPYNDYSNPSRAPFAARQANMQRSVYDYGSIEFETRGDAEVVLGYMRDICDEQGFCTVFNYYEITGNRPNSTDINYGWYELPEGIVKVQKKFNGYYRLTLPPVVAIK